MLAEVRRNGFAQGRQGEPWSVSTVAAAVRGADDAVVAAVSVVVPTEDIEPAATSTPYRRSPSGSHERCAPR